MPAYRFYDLTPADPEEMGRAAFFSDGAAVTWAMRRAGPGGVEVWQGARFVGRLHGANSTAADPGRTARSREGPAGDLSLTPDR